MTTQSFQKTRNVFLTLLIAIISATVLAPTTPAYAAKTPTGTKFSQDKLVECYADLTEITKTSDKVVKNKELSKLCEMLKSDKTYEFNFGVFHYDAIEDLQLEVGGMPKVMQPGKKYQVKTKVSYAKGGVNYVIKSTRWIKSSKKLRLNIDLLYSDDYSAKDSKSGFAWFFNSSTKYDCLYENWGPTKTEGSVQIGFRISTKKI